MAAKHPVNLKVVEEFLRRKIYPKEIAKDKGKKANFRRSCKNFSIKVGELFYKKSKKVIFDEHKPNNKRITIIGTEDQKLHYQLDRRCF